MPRRPPPRPPPRPSEARPDLTLEAAARAEGHARVAGVDEAGRGPLAGPVVAAAVILDPAVDPAALAPGGALWGLDDSKRLRPARREVLAAEIRRLARWGVAEASAREVDSLNVWGATALAMARALGPLGADLALVDGPLVPANLPCTARAVVGGDGRSASIAAASVLAKVARDRIMRDLARDEPRYGWATNMGYPTAAHRAALREHGPTPHHRRSFGPVRDLWCPDDSEGPRSD